MEQVPAEMLPLAAGVLADLSTRIAERLGRLLEATNEFVQLQAASRILELSIRLRDDADLERRIRELETLLEWEGRDEEAA